MAAEKLYIGDTSSETILPNEIYNRQDYNVKQLFSLLLEHIMMFAILIMYIISSYIHII